MKRKFAYVPLVSLGLLMSPATNANDQRTLTVVPDKCVALRKGQTCYQRVKIRFKLDNTGNYCLYLNDNEQAEKCWSGVASGEYMHDVRSSENVEISLQKNSTVVAQTRVTVAWVYKNKPRRRSSWRLF